MTEFVFGDVRTSARGMWLLDRMVETGSLVMRELGGDRSGEVAAHRFLSSPHVTVAGLVKGFSAWTAAAAAGRRVVAAQDTTEINFKDRSAKRRGLGPGGDAKTPAFFIHPVVGVDAQDEAVLGVVDAQIWTRAPEPVGPGQERARLQKESDRWLEATRRTGKVLADAAQVVVVGDREGDIWDHFAHRPGNVDLAIRARHDRPVIGETSLFKVLAEAPLSVAHPVKVASKGVGDKGRVAKVALRSGRVSILRPRAARRSDPKTLDLGLVEAIEIDPPEGVKPLLWRILTTLPVETFDDAAEVVRLYRLRWRIEEVFRALKRDGLALEDTQVQDAERLFRLAALALGAAVRILQLVDARDGGSRPMSDILDPNLQSAVAVLVKAREGATERQKNPHRPGSLAWLSWVVARFGGWNCYYKPPGPKTMAKGWERFVATLAGVLIGDQQGRLIPALENV